MVICQRGMGLLNSWFDRRVVRTRLYHVHLQVVSTVLNWHSHNWRISSIDIKAGYWKRGNWTITIQDYENILCIHCWNSGGRTLYLSCQGYR